MRNAGMAALTLARFDDEQLQELLATFADRGVEHRYDEEMSNGVLVGNLDYGLAAQIAEEQGLEVLENGDA